MGGGTPRGDGAWVWSLQAEKRRQGVGVGVVSEYEEWRWVYGATSILCGSGHLPRGRARGLRKEVLVGSGDQEELRGAAQR